MVLSSSYDKNINSDSLYMFNMQEKDKKIKKGLNILIPSF